MEALAPAALVEHFFRHESGRLVAVLTRRFGAHRLGAIEDAIQVALERALGSWARRGVPEEPSAWLTRVARNHLIDQLRRERIAEAHGRERFEPPNAALEDVVEDTLILLFACADERLAPRTRLVLSLKLLSGFSTEEIAARLFLTPETVQKTLERGRKRLAESWSDERVFGAEDANADERLETVQRVLYLQFNEGYTLGSAEQALRTEICEEAIRLTRLLASHSSGNRPSTWALLALMHLSASRLPARLDATGRFVPFEDQDRSLWDRRHIALGLAAVEESTRGSQFSPYHGEAAIQVEYVTARSFGETRWGEIAELYAALERMRPSPIYALNRAIAVAQDKGPEAGLAALDAIVFPPWFSEHHLLQGTRGELLRRAGRLREAEPFLRRARDAAPSAPERRHYEAKLAEVVV